MSFRTFYLLNGKDTGEYTLYLRITDSLERIIIHQIGTADIKSADTDRRSVLIFTNRKTVNSKNNAVRTRLIASRRPIRERVRVL